MIRRLIIPVLIAVLLGTFGAFGRNGVGDTTAAVGAVGNPAYTLNQDGLFIYIPSNAAQQQPLQVLVAIHGMGGNGSDFCQNLLLAAERNGWIVVAPTFRYQDYRNPDAVLQDDVNLLPRLAGLIDDLPARTGLLTRSKVLLYGHSRGAQMVHRFATVYPDRAAGVVALSAGSYTLPLQTMLVNGQSQRLPLPYGVDDMPRYFGASFDYAAFKRVPFRVEIGGADTNPNEAPRAWDAYLGVNRVERARAYSKTLADLGLDVTLQIYPGAGHGVTEPMHDDALRFLEGIVAGHAAQYGKAPAQATGIYGVAVTAAGKRQR